MSEELATGLPLDLAAGGLGNAASGEQEEPEKIQVVRFRDRLADDPRHLMSDEAGGVLPLHLLRQRPAFPRRPPRPRTPPHSRAGGRMGRLHRPLDVLGIVICPADDDQVLQATGDEELAVLDEPEIPRPQEGAFPVPAIVARKICSVSSGRCQ